jgi:hypothetical protein
VAAEIMLGGQLMRRRGYYLAGTWEKPLISVSSTFFQEAFLNIRILQSNRYPSLGCLSTAWVKEIARQESPS